MKQVIPGFYCRTLLGVTKQLCSCDRCLGTLWNRLTPAESQVVCHRDGSGLAGQAGCREGAEEAAS